MVADVRTQNRFVVHRRSMAVLVAVVALVVMAGTTSASAQIVEAGFIEVIEGRQKHHDHLSPTLAQFFGQRPK